MTLTSEKALEVLKAAWGRKSGYCFFPWIQGDAKDKHERIQSYNEGPAFIWPTDRDKILAHMESHREDDLYWCPSLFDYGRRLGKYAQDEGCLWADLDEVNPESLGDYPPTVAWETSPGRYQALWVLNAGTNLQGASWPGRENQRLTQYIGADPSGWDTTQLLRIPGWTNHKPEYRVQLGNGKGIKEPQGSLVWTDWKLRRRYFPDDFTDLPAIPDAGPYDEIIEDIVDQVDYREVWGRVRLQVSTKVRELVAAKVAQGDRSDVLWQIERDLADAGCSVAEIIAIVRETVWNKYTGRQDEFRRLLVEANKAVAMREVKKDNPLEPTEDLEYPVPGYFQNMVANVKPPVWLIDDIWTKGSCGFIAGEPKGHKSWLALDMALSVASGGSFLGRFPVAKAYPVLFIQEEDGLPTLAKRYETMWVSKTCWDVDTESEVETGLLPIKAIVHAGMVLSEPRWQSYLDDLLATGCEGVPYGMVILDPFINLMGDVDEMRAGAMRGKIFNPLKQLSQKYDLAVCMIHHLSKRTDGNAGARKGQRLLGSVANHAWVEDALYLSREKNQYRVDRESKFAPELTFRLSGVIGKKDWNPIVTNLQGVEDKEEDAPVVHEGRPKPRDLPNNETIRVLQQSDKPMTFTQLRTASTCTKTATLNQLERGQKAGFIRKDAQGNYGLVQ